MEASVLRRCSSYRGVRFTEVSIKRELTVSVKKIYTIRSGDRFRKAVKSAADARPKRRKKVRF